MKMRSVIASIGCAVAFSVSSVTPVLAADAADANKLLTESKCTKCHSIDKKKDGPSYKEVAAKYKGKADAVAKLTKHMTEPSMVEVDGEQEEHGTVKTRDPKRVKNLVDFILSL